MLHHKKVIHFVETQRYNVETKQQSLPTNAFHLEHVSLHVCRELSHDSLAAS